MDKPRVIFFGTSAFGLPVLAWLYENTSLVAVATSPDKPVGRKQELSSSPVKQWLGDKQIILLQPNDLKNIYIEQVLKHLSLDVAVVASYGKIITKNILDIPRKGFLNLHVALLPKYRGAAPMQYAIWAGEKVTGVTLFVLDELLDHGPIISQKEISVDPDETFESLHKKSEDLSVELLDESLFKYLSSEIKPREQNHELATLAPSFKKEDGKIDWQKPADEIDRQIRALNPWPGTYSKIKMEKSKIKIEEQGLKIFKVEISDKKLKPGEVEVDNKRIFIGTGTVALEILELQVSGGKRMKAADFAAGVGDKLKLI